MGYGLVIGFIEHLQIVTTSTYSIIANSHILQFTTACTKSSQSALLCLHWLSPGNTPNAVDASASMFNGSGPCWLAAISQLTQCCYTTAYNNWSYAASHASDRAVSQLLTADPTPSRLRLAVGLHQHSHSWLQSPQHP
jgi:hypothetical protein